MAVSLLKKTVPWFLLGVGLDCLANYKKTGYLKNNETRVNNVMSYMSDDEILEIDRKKKIIERTVRKIPKMIKLR